MKEKNITALISCFSRYYHYKNNKSRIYNDHFAEKLLSKEEINSISLNMTKGINFFNPNFKGNKEECLKYIVNNQLAPSVLGRSAFCEEKLNNNITIGCNQYLIYASGYDTSGYKDNLKNIKVFEIDRKEMIEDKINRLKRANINKSNINYITCDFTKENWINNILKSPYNQNEKSFNSLMGISYYLSKEDFNNMIKNISNIISKESTIIFDYPTYEESKEATTNEKLAEGANEKMKSKYSYNDIEKVLLDNNLYIYEHLDSNNMTEKYFQYYNKQNPNNKIVAQKGVAYCYAIKK